MDSNQGHYNEMQFPGEIQCKLFNTDITLSVIHKERILNLIINLLLQLKNDYNIN